jgi:hypothetical protein
MDKWTRTSNYMGDDYSDYYVVISHHRDSGILDESNYHAVYKTLKDYKGFVAPRFRNWLVGWHETIMIHESDTEGIDTAQELMDALSDYPILDDVDFSNREWDEVVRISDDIERDISNCDIDEDIDRYWPGFNKTMNREQIEDKVYNSDMVQL